MSNILRSNFPTNFTIGEPWIIYAGAMNLLLVSPNKLLMDRAMCLLGITREINGINFDTNFLSHYTNRLESAILFVLVLLHFPHSILPKKYLQCTAITPYPSPYHTPFLQCYSSHQVRSQVERCPLDVNEKSWLHLWLRHCPCYDRYSIIR